jgi:nucleotide-binding universal stress UspA family protein
MSSAIRRDGSLAAGAGHRHIACVVDGSAQCRRALQEAQRLSAAGGGRLSAVHVDPWIALVMACPEWVSDPDELRDCALAWLRGELAEVGVGEAVPAVFDTPAALRRWAREAGVDLIVAARRRGPLRWVLRRSVVSGLDSDAPCPILLIE